MDRRSLLQVLGMAGLVTPSVARGLGVPSEDPVTDANIDDLGDIVGGIIIGTRAGENLTTGRMNTFIGTGAGRLVETGSHNVIIGPHPGWPDMEGRVIIADGNGKVRFSV